MEPAVSLAPAIPPGEDDLPFDDGEEMETEQHRKQMTVLCQSLERAWRDRDDVYVGANMAVYFSELQVKKNDFRGPDVFVVLDTVRRVRKSWVVWQEGGRTPDVVIELLSPSTEEVDRGEKMRVYAKLLRVANCYLFDPIDGRFEGYALDLSRREYVRMQPGPGGDLPCPPLGLGLGVRHGVIEGAESDWLRWLDAQGNVLPTSEERAQEAERRLAEALGEIERLKGGA
jgi:Uma2 family endonuclease